MIRLRFLQVLPVVGLGLGLVACAPPGGVAHKEISVAPAAKQVKKFTPTPRRRPVRRIVRRAETKPSAAPAPRVERQPPQAADTIAPAAETPAQRLKRFPAGTHTPTRQQKSQAIEAMARFLRAFDGGRYREAHAMFDPEGKAAVTFAAFQSLGQSLGQSVGAGSGGPILRNQIEVAWNKNPDPADTLVFADFVITCRAAGATSCREELSLREQQDGSFRVSFYNRAVSRF